MFCIKYTLKTTLLVLNVVVCERFMHLYMRVHKLQKNLGQRKKKFLQLYILWHFHIVFSYVHCYTCMQYTYPLCVCVGGGGVTILCCVLYSSQPLHKDINIFVLYKSEVDTLFRYGRKKNKIIFISIFLYIYLRLPITIFFPSRFLFLFF